MSPRRIRIDKWLWYARLFKSRSMASRTVLAGKMRVNRRRILKPSASIRPGDVLTYNHGHRIRVIEVVSLATRRGPASEAHLLYTDLVRDRDGRSDEPEQIDQSESSIQLPGVMPLP